MPAAKKSEHHPALTEFAASAGTRDMVNIGGPIAAAFIDDTQVLWPPGMQAPDAVEQELAPAPTSQQRDMETFLAEREQEARAAYAACPPCDVCGKGAPIERKAGSAPAKAEA